MEYLVIAALIAPVVIGFLLGLMRGSRRSILRLVLIILCVVAAFLLKNTVTNQALAINVNGQPLSEFIIASFGDKFVAISDVLMPIASLIVAVILFLLMFLLLEFVSWAIIFPICKIFVKKARKKEDGTYGRKHALLGGIIGIVQGAIVGLVMCITLNGLFYNVSNVTNAINSLNENGGSGEANAIVMMADAEGEQGEGADPSKKQPSFNLELLTTYSDSKVCQTLNKTGGLKMFDFVASMKTEGGKKITLTGQLDALTGVVKMAKELMSIGDMQMVGGLTGDLATDIAAIFNRLDAIYGNLSGESKETIGDLTKVVAGLLPTDQLGISLDGLNLGSVDFKKEGEVLTELNSYKDLKHEDITTEVAENIVKTVMKSDILLPMLSSNDQFTIGLNAEQKEFAEAEIEKLAQAEDADEDKIGMLKKFFGINDEAEQEKQPEQSEEKNEENRENITVQE